MPDIKTEMSKVLTAWEKDAQATLNPPTPPAIVKKAPDGRIVFTKTNNVTEETFNQVRDNPGQTATQIYAALTARGFKESSASSLLSQFCRQGLVRKDEQLRYYATQQTYTPIKSSKVFRAEQKRQAKILSAEKARQAKALKAKAKTQPPSQGIAALKAEPVGKVTGVTASVATAWDADTIINNIGLKQARALYDELKKIFGG